MEIVSGDNDSGSSSDAAAGTRRDHTDRGHNSAGSGAGFGIGLSEFCFVVNPQYLCNCLYFFEGGACNTALSSLRSVREEQGGLFRRRKPSSAPATCSWTHKFMCLHSTTADRTPTTRAEKLTLEDAGLGERSVTVPDLDCSPGSFQKVLLDAYPKLEEGGGFECLRCKPQSRDLVMIGPRVASSPRYYIWWSAWNSLARWQTIER